MFPENLKVSSEQFWISSVIFILVDGVLIFLLVRFIKPSRFRELKWTLVFTAAIFWSIFSLLIVSAFWNIYYRYFYPTWFQSGGILIFVPILYGAFASAFYWLAWRIPGNPMVNFLLLAGLESLLEHYVGIYGLKILEAPILQEASPGSILVFSFPEYILYWCLVISIALLVQNGWRWLTNRFRTKIAA